MIINRQNAVGLNLAAIRAYVRRLGKMLCLEPKAFTICFVDDREIERLNGAYRSKLCPTDVLSFPWKPGREGERNSNQEFKGYLGDVVISVETARENARSEGHSIQTEIKSLILHGVLHLLGHDHETDRGEMTALELSLREQLSLGVPRWGAGRNRKE